MRIVTNYVPRLVIEDYELTAAERKEFDYLDWEVIDDGQSSASFVRYKGRLYDLGEFTYATGDQFGSYWQGYRDDTFYSGVLVRYFPDTDHVVMGRYDS